MEIYFIFTSKKDKALHFKRNIPNTVFKERKRTSVKYFFSMTYQCDEHIIIIYSETRELSSF